VIVPPGIIRVDKSREVRSAQYMIESGIASRGWAAIFSRDNVNGYVFWELQVAQFSLSRPRRGIVDNNNVYRN
jgi:hypothetical protein